MEGANWNGALNTNKNQSKNEQSSGSDLEIKSINTSIYFYSSITSSTVLDLVIKIENLTKEIIKDNVFNENVFTESADYKPILLYINSPGGELISTLAVMDRIKSNKVPIYTIVEGYAASGASILSIVGSKRFMRKNSMMLIHELSGEIWGKLSKMKESVEQSEKMMAILINIYRENTTMSEETLSNLLKHDYYLTAKECLQYGLIDTIIE